MKNGNSRTQYLLTGILLLVTLFSLGFAFKNHGLEKRIEEIEKDYDSILTQYTIVRRNMMEEGYHEDYAEGNTSLQDITVDFYDSYSELNENICIPAYGPVSRLSVLRDTELNSYEIIDRDDNMTQISLKAYIPNWMLEMNRREIDFNNRMSYLVEESPLFLNPNDNSAQNTLLTYATPVKEVLSYKEWVYVESLVKRDANILYKGWVKKESLGAIELSDSMKDVYCFIEKGKEIVKGNVETTAVMNQWGRILEEDETYYTVSTLGTEIYRIKKEDVLFIEDPFLQRIEEDNQ